MTPTDTTGPGDTTQPGTPNANTDNTGTNPTGNNQPTNPNEYPETEEIIDFDAPQAAPESTQTPGVSAVPASVPASLGEKLPDWAIITGGVVLLGLVALLFWLLLFHRKKKWHDQNVE